MIQKRSLMQKNWNFRRFDFFFCLAILLPAIGASQKVNLYKECYPCDLIELLSELEKDYDFHFSYDVERLESLSVEGKIENGNIRHFLQYALEDASLQPVFIAGNEVLIMPVEQVLGKEESALIEICGKIKDNQSKEPLAAAVIILNEGEKGVYTNNSGSFNFPYAFTERDSITISYLGYEPIVFNALDLQGSPCQKIYLSPTELILDDVLVEERQIQLMEIGAKANEIIIRHDRMGDAPGLGEPDVLRIVQMLPGINSASGLAGQLNIRGGTPDENLILWDDIPVYHIGHFFGIFSPFNPYIIDEVSVFKGDFGVEYGERNSGVIDIESRPGQSSRPTFGFGANGLNAHIFLELPVLKKKGRFLLAARKSFTNTDKSSYNNLIGRVFGNELFEQKIQTIDSIDVGGFSNRFSFGDINAKFFYRPGKKRQFSFSLFVAQDEIIFSQRNPDSLFYHSDDRLSLINGGFSLKLKRYWNESINTEYSLVSSNFQNISLHQFTTDTSILSEERLYKENVLSDSYFKIHNEIRHKRQQFVFGLKFANQLIEHKYDYTHYHKEPVIDNRSQRDLYNMLYLNYRINLDEKLIFDAGMRFDYLRSFETTLPAPRYNLMLFPFGPELKFKSSGGFYLQYLRQYFESDVFGLGNHYWLPLNEEINKPVKTLQWSNGITYLKNGYLLDGEFYLKFARDIVHRDVFEREQLELSFGDANIYGLDFLFKKQFTKFSTWLAYSYNQTLYRFPYYEGEFPASHEQRHVINWTNALTLQKFDIALSWNLASGRPYTKGIGFIETESPVTSDSYFEVNYGPINQERYPIFSRFDFSANYKIVRRDWSLKFGLSVLNLTNRQNILQENYSVAKNDDNQPELISNTRYLIPFTPNLFVLFKIN